MFKCALYQADKTYSGKEFCFLLNDLRVCPWQERFRAFVHSAAAFEDRSASYEIVGEGPLYRVEYTNLQEKAHRVLEPREDYIFLDSDYVG